MGSCRKRVEGQLWEEGGGAVVGRGWRGNCRKRVEGQLWEEGGGASV